MTYYQMQKLAKETFEFVKTVIRVGMPLKELKEIAENKMIKSGATSFWYWNVGALIFSDKDTVLSVSGKNYAVSDNSIKENDVITIDLSPQHNDLWGDYARTIIVENGKVVNCLDEVQNREWKDGLLFEEQLHKNLLSYATPQTTFEDIYFYFNDLITKSGYKNLDFMGNLGHSIVKDKNDRIYIEQGNKEIISSVKYFTFEPHISKEGSFYGYKREDIYYFENGILKIL